MKVDQMIKELQMLREKYGDVEVYNMATGYQVDTVDLTEDSQDENISIIVI